MQKYFHLFQLTTKLCIHLNISHSTHAVTMLFLLLRTYLKKERSPMDCFKSCLLKYDAWKWTSCWLNFHLESNNIVKILGTNNKKKKERPFCAWNKITLICHLHIYVCHLKMSVWEQDNGNNLAAHFQIKFCRSQWEGCVCSSLGSKSSVWITSPQGLMDVIQILDFHHFKLWSFCHWVT